MDNLKVAAIVRRSCRWQQTFAPSMADVNDPEAEHSTFFAFRHCSGGCADSRNTPRSFTIRWKRVRASGIRTFHATPLPFCDPKYLIDPFRSGANVVNQQGWNFSRGHLFSMFSAIWRERAFSAVCRPYRTADLSFGRTWPVVDLNWKSLIAFSRPAPVAVLGIFKTAKNCSQFVSPISHAQ